MSDKKCEHTNFDSFVDINRITDGEGGPVHRFNACIRIVCTDCNTPFRFIGLPCGLDFNGAAVSVDGTEARLCIAPPGEVMTPLDGVTGFTARRTR